MRYFFTLLLFIPVILKAQTGNYFLLHYAPGNERLDYVCFDMTQNAKGIMYFATRSGVLEFDGRNWDLITGNGAVYALEIDAKGIIYWAGAKGFGKIVYDDNGQSNLQKLSGPDVKDVYQALALKDHVYFLNDEAIYVIKPNQAITSIPASTFSGSFTSLFELFGKPYVSTDKSGSFKIESAGLARSNLLVLEDTEIAFSSHFENSYLIGTLDSKLFIYTENLAMREIQLQDVEYVTASVVVSGTWLNRHLIALGTLRGGVVFVNPYTGKTEEIINYSTGLPDNEVFALMSDSNKNIWTAHDYGFTRISPFLPFRSFSHYDGLKGNLLCAVDINDEVYVGTSLGLFKLVKEEVYEEIVYYVDVAEKEIISKEIPKTPTTTNEELASPSTPVVTQAPSKPKKGFLRFLKRNRDKVEEESIDENAVESVKNEPVKPEIKPEIQQETRIVTNRLKKTEKVLRSSQYVYKKVKGIEAKVTHLADVDGKLIASGLAGVFEVNDLQATTILEEPIRFMFSFKSILIIVSTYADKVRTLRHNGKNWSRVKLIDKLDDQITFVFEGINNELWLCSLDRIYRIELNSDQLKSIDHFELVNPNFSKTLGIRWKDEIVIANSEGFFRYDRLRNKLVEIDSLPSPKTYFASTGNLWYHDEHTWNVLGNFNRLNNVHMLNVNQELRFITSDRNSDNLWIITGNNELYKFFGEKLSPYAPQYPLFVRSIKVADKQVSTNSKFKIDQEAGILTIDVIQPSFMGPESTEYRYFLEGLDKEWSEWARDNNRMNFPYLPPGNYTLLVESRDIFGSIIQMNPLDFVVRPPYWKRPWFYAMEFAIFALLVLLSFRLSFRYRFISRLLSLLTIILLIELIQTVAGSTFTTNSSPVIDFLIQVAIAFLILPIEGYLRNLMFKSMGSGSRLYQIISDLDNQGKLKNNQ